jgi:hypothetical protein
MALAFEVYDAEVDEYGIPRPTRFVRVALGGHYRTALRGPKTGWIDDWMPDDSGRLVIVTHNRATVLGTFTI